MAKQTTSERLAVLEIKVDDINENIVKILAEITSINKAMNVKDRDHIQLRAEVLANRKAIEKLTQQSNLWRWLSPTLTAIFTAGVTFLLIHYLQNVGG